MNVERLRSSFLTLVASELAAATGAVEAERTTRLAAAHVEADRLIAEARATGRLDAADETRRLVADARRQARGETLTARRAVYDQLRCAALAASLRLRDAPGYGALLDRLTADVRARLGADADVDVDPDPGGGVIARDARRVVDCSLPALSRRCLDGLGSSVEELWQ